jgi:hypothetical protein
VSGHQGDTLPIKEGIYTTGYVAVCECGWAGSDVARHSEAIQQLAIHLRDVERNQP